MDIFEHWKGERRHTIRVLFELADEIDKVANDVNIAKVTGTATAIACGIGALFFPPLAAGAVAGAVTATGAEIAKSYLDGAKMNEVQDALDKDKRETEKLNEFMEEFLVYQSKVKKDAVRDALGNAKKAAQAVEKIAGKYGAQISKLVARGDAAKLAKVSKVATKLGKGARVAGKALGILMIPFEIKDLVETSIEIHNGSPSEVANDVREKARDLRDQLDEIEEAEL